MIQLTATGRDARATPSEPITAGSVGLPVVLDLSSDFDGLAVTVCFEAGEAKVDVAYLGDPVTVPLQCLAVVGAVLRIGVYGALPIGTIVIPTVWATVGLVRKGAVPSGVDPSQPEPDWTAQVLAAARDAKETAERIAGEVDEWAEAEAARVRAEDARDSAEAARRSAEQARAGAETIRADAETQRVNAEGIRITNESARTSNELARATAEQGRATAETGRALAETARAEAEQVRATAETARNGAEAARAQAESQRADAERQRASAETARATAEQTRATAEQGRAAAETARAEAEQARATAEQSRAVAEASRAQAWAELEADVTAATDAATEAAAALRPEVDWLRGNQLTGELSGDILTAADAYAAPPMSLVVDGRSTQDGTPTPDAPVPIESIEVLNMPVTFAGKNLFDKSAATKGKYLDVNGNEVSQVSWGISDYISVVAGTQLTISGSRADGTTKNCWYGMDKQFLSSFAVSNQTVTVPSGAAYLRMSVPRNTSTYELYDVQLELGSTATTYEPYHGTTAQIPMQGHVLRSLPDGTKDTMTLTYLRPSTREGWAWYARELVQRIERHEVSTTDEGWSSDGTLLSHSRGSLPSWVGWVKWKLCNACEAVKLSVGAVAVVINSTVSVEDFVSAMDGAPLVVMLALDTPVTTQLDPIELPVLPAPTCTVWADPTTGLTMEYVQDTNLVIASLQAALADLATS